MYCAVYRFTMLDVPNAENRFITAWTGITDFFKTEAGALGSRLHRGNDGAFYAYAQWPDKKTYEAAREVTPTEDFGRHRLEWAEVCAPSEVLFEGKVMADLFV